MDLNYYANSNNEFIEREINVAIKWLNSKVRYLFRYQRILFEAENEKRLKD